LCPQQQKNSQYARDFQKPEAAGRIKPEMLVMWVKEPQAREAYLEAMQRSSIEGMLNCYKANFPREPYKADTSLPPVKCSVLMAAAVLVLRPCPVHQLDVGFMD
jgi:hypothetical protein